MSLGGYDRKYRGGYGKKKKYRTPYVPAETVAAAAAGLTIPESYGDIATASDIKSTLCAGLDNSTTPTTADPDYMWVFNQASGGAVEVGGSGEDLDQNTGVDVNQTPTVLSGANVCVTDANTDLLNIADNSNVSPLTGSFLQLCIFVGYSNAETRRVQGDRDSSSPNEGWEQATDPSNNYDATLDDSVEGTLTAGNLSGEYAQNTLQVIAFQIDVTAGQIASYANNGTRITNTAAWIGTASIQNPTSRFGIGDISFGNAMLGEWGVLAQWRGTAAEGDWSTRIANLFSNLGGS